MNASNRVMDVSQESALACTSSLLTATPTPYRPFAQAGFSVHARLIVRVRMRPAARADAAHEPLPPLKVRSLRLSAL